MELGSGEATPGNDKQVFLPGGGSEPVSPTGSKMPPSTVILMLSEFLPFALSMPCCEPGLAYVRDGYASEETAPRKTLIPPRSFSCEYGVGEPVALPAGGWF